jgi:hypothetical protein
LPPLDPGDGETGALGPDDGVPGALVGALGEPGPDEGPEDAPDEDPDGPDEDPDGGPDEDPDEDPGELGGMEVPEPRGRVAGPDPGFVPDPPVGPGPVTGLEQPEADPEHTGGGGGYGAVVGAAAAVATTLPSRKIRPATRKASERACRTRPPRAGRRDGLIRPGMVRMVRGPFNRNCARELYEAICRMYMRCSRSGLHQYFINCQNAPDKRVEIVRVRFYG